jgi:hypothetical protein
MLILILFFFAEIMSYQLIKQSENNSHYFIKIEQCLYIQYSSTATSKYLRCIEKECNCRGKVLAGRFIRTNFDCHQHMNHTLKARCEIAMEELRDNVRNETRAIRAIHHEYLRTLTRDVAALLPFKKVRKTLQRVCASQLPSCGSLDALGSLLEDENSLVFNSFGMLRDKPFYQGMAGGHLIFANLHLIESLPEKFHMYVDATFSITPFKAYQLLVILGELQEKARPLINVVMRGKSKQVSVNCDFEVALRQGLVEVWSEIKVSGCNFHFCQALRRKAKSMPRLATKITGNTLHHTVLFMYMRLSLLPIDHIKAGIAAIQRYVSLNKIANDFKQFHSYFMSTWMHRYSKSIWCVSDNIQRTNNYAEGHNNKLKHVIKRNPNHWDFLNGLLDLCFDAIAEYDHDVTYNSQSPPNTSKITKALPSALEALNNGEIEELSFLLLMARP